MSHWAFCYFLMVLEELSYFHSGLLKLYLILSTCSINQGERGREEWRKEGEGGKNFPSFNK